MPVTVGVEEQLEPVVVGAAQLQLPAPHRDDHRGVLAGVRRQDALRGQLVGQLRDLDGGHLLGVVGEPDGAVLEAVDRVLVAHRLVVHPAGEPDRRVRPAGRRDTVVLDLVLDVVGAQVLVDHDRVQRGCGELAPAVQEERHRDGDRDEQQRRRRGQGDDELPPATGRRGQLGRCRGRVGIARQSRSACSIRSTLAVS